MGRHSGSAIGKFFLSAESDNKAEYHDCSYYTYKHHWQIQSFLPQELSNRKCSPPSGGRSRISQIGEGERQPPKIDMTIKEIGPREFGRVPRAPPLDPPMSSAVYTFC